MALSIDWSSAQVEDGRLEVGLSDKPDADWKRSFSWVAERLDRHGHGWGEVSLTKHGIRVSDVEPGGESDIRHFLESVVQQANADTAPAEADEAEKDRGEDDSGQRDSPDANMGEAFRSFAEQSEPERSDR